MEKIFKCFKNSIYLYMFDQAKLKYNYFKIFKNIIFKYYQKYFVVYILVYMCALYVCTQKGTFTCAHVYWDQRLAAAVFYCYAPYDLKCGFSLNLELSNWLDFLRRDSLISCSLLCPMLGLQCVLPHLTLVCRYWRHSVHFI